jgi:hypothetical protein
MGSMSAGVKKEFLGQPPPRASAHACTTTTSATAHRAKIATIGHWSLNSRLNGPCRQLTHVTLSIHNLDGKNHNFCRGERSVTLGYRISNLALRTTVE